MKYYLLLLLFLLCTNSFSQNPARKLLLDGDKAYRLGKYEESFALFSRAAILGNDTAQFALGFMYEYGIGVGPNEEKAKEWYLKSAQQGMDLAFTHYEYLTLNRVAVLIGNSDYIFYKRYQHVYNDINSIAHLLKGLRFDVINPHYNLNNSLQMKDCVDAFMSKAEHSDVVLFYYTGAACELVVNGKQKNYLIPTGAKDITVANIDSICFDLSYLIDKLSKSKIKRIVLLIDADRTGFGMPLSYDDRIKIDLPVETILVFSTLKGNGIYTSSNTSLSHSPFASAIISTLDVHDLTIDDFISLIANKVRIQSDGKQEIDKYGEISNFYLRLDN